MRSFIDQHHDTHGVEPICKVPQIAPWGYRRYAARQRNPELRCECTQRDATLIPQIERAWQMNREGMPVARCTVELIMRHLGPQGVRRDKVVRTTIPDNSVPCPLDRVKR